jgi:methionyl-tRNA synthetase
MLLGYETLNLPYDVPANQYVNFSAGQKQSKSKGTGTWVLDLLDTYAPDVIRFYLTTILPETSDSEFREEDLIRANNDMLIATWGNLANRVLAMLQRNFNGVVPDPGTLAPESTALVHLAEEAFVSAGTEYGACRFRSALQEGLRLAQAANRYLDERAPWKAVKADLPHAAETLATALNVINALKVIFHPILPFSTQALHDDLNLGEPLDAHGWQYSPVPAGTRLHPPHALYAKLDPDTLAAKS